MYVKKWKREKIASGNSARIRGTRNNQMKVKTAYWKFVSRTKTLKVGFDLPYFWNKIIAKPLNAEIKPVR